MSKFEIIILIISIILVLSQNNYPMIPNPGYDTITVVPVFGNENKNISEMPQTHIENTISIMSNKSITVNTSDIDPQCTLECYTGCRILFPEYIEQKFCVSNFCKCKIIEKQANLSNNNIYDNSSIVETIHSELNKYGVTQYLDLSKKFIGKSKYDNYYYIFYFIIFAITLGYEYIIIKYIEKINEFSIIKWLIEDNDFKYKKYRITYEYEFDNINELRTCLI